MSFSREKFVDGVIEYLEQKSGIGPNNTLVGELRQKADDTYSSAIELLSRHRLYLLGDHVTTPQLNPKTRQILESQGLEAALGDSTETDILFFVRWAASLLLSQLSRTSVGDQKQILSV